MESRFKNLRQILHEQHLDAVLISSVPNITYLSNYGGFSIEERDAFLLVTSSQASIITNALYITAIREKVKHMDVYEQTRDNPLRSIIATLIEKKNIKRIGFEDKDLSVAEYNVLAPLKEMLTPINLEKLRVIKDHKEILAIKKACQIGDEAFSFIQTQIKIGMTEEEIANDLELAIKQRHADPSFRAIVAFGKNAAVPHHLSGTTKLTKNTNILIDFGVKYQQYCSDMTRNIFFGKPTSQYRAIYQTVFDAQQLAITYIEDALKTKHFPIATNIDGLARDYVVAKGYPPFNHSSHGIGLEVHEIPHITRSQDPVINGMIFSIEPGVYLPNKTGVRIEDLFCIERNKLIRLTHSSRELIELPF